MSEIAFNLTSNDQQILASLKAIDDRQTKVDAGLKAILEQSQRTAAGIVEGNARVEAAQARAAAAAVKAEEKAAEARTKGTEAAQAAATRAAEVATRLAEKAERAKQKAIEKEQKDAEQAAAKLLREQEKLAAANAKLAERAEKAAKAKADNEEREAKRAEAARARAEERAKRAAEAVAEAEAKAAAAKQKILERQEAREKAAAEEIYQAHAQLKAKQVDNAREAALNEAKAIVKAADDQIKLTDKVQAVYEKAEERKKREQSRTIDSMTSNIFGMASAYVSLNTLATAYTENLRIQVELQGKSLEYAQRVGKSQAVSVQNMTGLTAKQKELVHEETLKLQAEIGFSDRAKLTDAAGAGFGASGDIKATMDATRAAAAVTVLNPEEIQTYTLGALMLKDGTGVDNAKANISFALQGSAQSLVKNPADYIRNVAKVVSSGVNTVPEQDKQEASRELAAVYNAFTQSGKDIRGETSSNAQLELNSRLKQFFSKLKDQREELDKKIRDNKSKVAAGFVDEAELKLADLDIANKEKIASRTHGKAKEKALAELDVAKARRDQIINQREEVEAARKKAEELSQTKQELDALEDPKKYFARIAVFQKSKKLRDLFLSDSFGSAEFKQPIEELLTGGSVLSGTVSDNASKLNFNTKDYFDTVAQNELTPEMEAAMNKSRGDAKDEIQKARDVKEGAVKQNIRDQMSVLWKTRRSGSLGGMSDFVYDQGMNLAEPIGIRPEKYAEYAITRLTERRQQFERLEYTQGGLTNSDAEKVKKLDEAIAEIQKIWTKIAVPMTPEARSREMQLMEEQNALLKQIAEKTPAGGATPNAIKARTEAARDE